MKTRFYVENHQESATWETKWRIRDRRYERQENIACIEADNIPAREDARIMCSALNRARRKR